MTREQAYELLTEMMSNKNLIRHGLAVEAIMRELCKYLKNRDSGRAGMTDLDFDEEEWGIVGLLHDADYELIEKDPTRHTIVTEEKLREKGFNNERIIQAIRAHHDGIKESRDNILESAVYAVDEMSGLITACALVQPEKKLETVTVESVMKKFKQPSFAAGTRRDQMTTGIKEIGMTLEDLTGLALKAMQDVHEDLGL